MYSIFKYIFYLIVYISFFFQLQLQFYNISIYNISRVYVFQNNYIYYKDRYINNNNKNTKNIYYKYTFQIVYKLIHFIPYLNIFLFNYLYFSVKDIPHITHSVLDRKIEIISDASVWLSSVTHPQPLTQYLRNRQEMRSRMHS